MKKLWSFLTVFLMVLLQLLINTSTANARPVNISPTNPSALSSGQSQVFTVSLDEPIICPVLDSTCKVVLTFTNSAPGTIFLNTTTLEWIHTSWRDIKTLIVTADTPLTYTHNRTATISSIATSNAEYYNRFSPNTISLSILRPSSPEEIATAARVAAEEAARLRQIEIDNFRKILFAKLIRGERPSLVEYKNASFNQIVDRTVEKVTSQLLALEVGKRVDVEVINEVADKAAYLEAFFNPEIRPTLEVYGAYGFMSVTERTLRILNEKVLAIIEGKRSQRSLIQEIANTEDLVDRIANPNSRAMVTASLLISKGLLPADTVYKYSVVQGLANYPEGSLNSMAKIEAAIKAELLKASARKARTEAIKAKILARQGRS